MRLPGPPYIRHVLLCPGAFTTSTILHADRPINQSSYQSPDSQHLQTIPTIPRFRIAATSRIDCGSYQIRSIRIDSIPIESRYRDIATRSRRGGCGWQPSRQRSTSQPADNHAPRSQLTTRTRTTSALGVSCQYRSYNTQHLA